MDFTSIWNGITIEQLAITISLGLNIYNIRQTMDLRRLYNQVDKLTYGIAIAIQKKTGIKLIRQSATGEGDHAMRRDV